MHSVHELEARRSSRGILRVSLRFLSFWDVRARVYYTARVTRYNELHGSCNSLHSSLHECRYMAKKLSLKKMVSLDLSLQRHLTGPLESSLQDFFRSLLKHQWETNCKLCEHHMRPDLFAELLQRQRGLSPECFIPAHVSAPVCPHPQNHWVLQHTV